MFEGKVSEGEWLTLPERDRLRLETATLEKSIGGIEPTTNCGVCVYIRTTIDSGARNYSVRGNPFALNFPATRRGLDYVAPVVYAELRLSGVARNFRQSVAFLSVHSRSAALPSRPYNQKTSRHIIPPE